MKSFVIGLVELKRMLRDRTNLFFVFLFPLILILLLGVTFGSGFVPKVGLVVADEGELTRELVRALRAQRTIEVVSSPDSSSLSDDVERGVFDAGVVIARRYSERLRSGDGADVLYVSKPGDFSPTIRAAVAAEVGRQSARARAALVATNVSRTSFDSAYRKATELTRTLPGTELKVTSAADDGRDRPVRFEPGASTMLILFTFVNSLAGSVALVQTRQHGVLRRMLVAPVRGSTILVGEGFGRFLIAAMQSVFIVFAAALLFGVDWGDPIGAAAVVVLFALVSTGAALLFGAVLRNEQQAGALVPFGLALAALGGCMVPLEVFPDTMRTVAHLTPHAWANDAFEKLVGQGARVTQILPQLAALSAFAIALLVSGALGLRRTLTT